MSIKLPSPARPTSGAPCATRQPAPVKSSRLELGGKSPFIVFEDADLDAAVEGVVDAIWFNQGQVCCAGSRLLVQENIAERFLNKLKARMEHMRVGDPLDKCIDMGAIVDQTQWDTIDSWVKTGVKEGGELFQPHIQLPEKGLFYPPTLICGLDPGRIDRPGRNLWPGAGFAHLPNAGRSHRAGQ